MEFALHASITVPVDDLFCLLKTNYCAHIHEGYVS